MGKLNERTIANMDYCVGRSLQRLCRIYIAQKLRQHAMQGDTTLTNLRGVAQSALKKITKPRKASTN